MNKSGFALHPENIYKGPIWNKGLKGTQQGVGNGMWKGNKVKYRGLHSWVQRTLGKANKCENPECVYPRYSFHKVLMIAPKRFEWANISHEYKRDISDWIQMCPSCHRKYDYQFRKFVL